MAVSCQVTVFFLNKREKKNDLCYFISIKKFYWLMAVRC